MSHRPEDVYGYVATGTIKTGMVTAFNTGDPVPDATVKANPSWLDDNLVIRRDEWDARPGDEPERPMERGEMPAHLRKVPAAEESATFKSVRAGGSSSKKPDTGKST